MPSVSIDGHGHDGHGIDAHDTFAQSGRHPAVRNMTIDTQVSPDTPSDLSGAMIGRTVSHFRVLDLLGTGGMGVVYRATDLELDRLVALKFLPSEKVRHERSRQRLLREARSASRLDHPNLCTVHEIGRTEDGQLFIAMACYHDGETLKHRLADGALDQEESLEVALQIAAGLGAAHGKAVVHRDIKPGNIMLIEGGRVKILDFGLALLGHETPSTGGAAGTYLYMSPEQVRGRGIDGRTDLWSLGVVLYEMLTGVPPFQGGSPALTLRSILNSEPRPVRRLNPAVHPGFERILRRCFVKSPHRRYQRAEELEADLLDLRERLNHDAREAGDPTARLDTGYLSPGPWTQSIAVLPFRNESAEAEQDYFCLGVTDEIITALNTLSGLRVIAKLSSLAYRDSKKSDREIAAELDVAHVLRGRIYKAQDDSRVRVNAELFSAVDDEVLWRRSYQKELEDIFAVQEDLARSIAGTLELVVTPSVFDASRGSAMSYDVWDAVKKSVHFADEFYFRARTSDFRQAIRNGRRALELSPDCLAAHVALAYAYSIRGYLASRLGELLAESDGRLRTLCERAVASLVSRRCIARADHHAESAYRIDPTSSMSLASKGGVCHLRGEHEQAFNLLSQAIRVNPSHALALHLMGRTVGLGFGLYDEAVRYFDRAIDLNPRSPFPYHNRGLARMNLGQLELAAADFEKALELQPNDHVALGCSCELAIVERDFRSARECIRRMEAIRPNTAGYQRALLQAAEQGRAAAATTRPKEAILGGAKGKALALLERLVRRTGAPGFLELHRHPIYSTLQDSERFRLLLVESERSYDLLHRRYGGANSPLVR